MQLERGEPLRFETRVPSDKSITHRALILGAISRGETIVRHGLPSRDCLATYQILGQLGVELNWQPDHTIRIMGGRLQESATVLDCQNSGTTMRLLAGLLAGQNFYSVLTGDASLNSRPMARIMEPLGAMGGQLYGRGGNKYPPLTIVGSSLWALDSYLLPVASAQLKSALLLAGLFARGTTTIIEPAQSRDHTERMLLDFGAPLSKEGDTLRIHSGELVGREVEVPGDFSSAAFLIASALIVPGSQVLLRDVGLNPTRIGLLTVLKKMGAKIQIQNRRNWGSEPVGDIFVQASQLTGTEVCGKIVPQLIDELPALAAVATQAQGTTIIRDAGELRVKESDRIGALCRELGRLGAQVEELPDGLVIHGGRPLVGAQVESYGDHRIAMAMAVAGLAAQGTTEILDPLCVEISFPNFWQFFGKNRK